MWLLVPAHDTCIINDLSDPPSIVGYMVSRYFSVYTINNSWNYDMMFGWYCALVIIWRQNEINDSVMTQMDDTNFCSI